MLPPPAAVNTDTTATVQHHLLQTLPAFLPQPPLSREQAESNPFREKREEISHIMGTSINFSICHSFPFVLRLYELHSMLAAAPEGIASHLKEHSFFQRRHLSFSLTEGGSPSHARSCCPDSSGPRRPISRASRGLRLHL